MRKKQIYLAIGMSIIIAGGILGCKKEENKVKCYDCEYVDFQGTVTQSESFCDPGNVGIENLTNLSQWSTCTPK